MKKICSVILTTLICIACSGCSDGETGSTMSGKEVSLQTVHDDNYISVSFVKVHEMPDISNTLFLDLQAKNNSDEKITVYLQDAYVNDQMVQFGSGVPLDLLPNKEKTHSFFCTFEAAGISSIDELEKIGFKAEVINENTEMIETTENIEVDF